MSKMATAGLERSVYFMRDQLERIEQTLKRMKTEQNEIYNYTVVPNESTSVSSVVEQVRDYESAENKRLRGKTE
tara:strand:- start:104 stop:325 length:222 start_codon:yes stop_codon:yes gene_type:complete